MEVFLDWFLEIFHVLMIAFVLLGWIWKRTRKAHLAAAGLIFFSWTVLGFRYGFGYCPCTDWHWQIKARLGVKGLPASFVKYLADSLTGAHWDADLVDAVVFTAGLLSLAVSIWLNWRDRKGPPRSVHPWN